ncbi:Uncharacterised protein [Vibrio cholerae]|uniref:hypothetical protein n=3 Tax=Vibrio cholerae TaxID=666 RepID=UPI000C70551A|nr:hypothetical protein [Vibrio cholerae]EGR4109114.1 hypothetical protein [Vibrio cholerae]SNC57038.1 Uncharacterised protein [Vibrio cholerae]
MSEIKINMKFLIMLIMIFFSQSSFAKHEINVEDLVLNSNEVLVFNESNWIVTRNIYNNNIRVNYSFISFDNILPLNLSKDNILQDIQIDKNGNLYLILYDAINNTPSGRSLTGVTNHSQIVFVDVHSKSVSILSTSLDLGGIDTALSSSQWGNGIAVCSINRCYSVENDNGVTDWDKSRWKNLYIFNDLNESAIEFVEVSFNNNQKIVSAIMRKTYDSRFNGNLTKDYADYYLVVFDDERLFHFEKIKDDVPWGLSFNNIVVNYKLVSQAENKIDVFYYDLERLTMGGKLQLAINNMEGRVVWSQLYYLNGIQSALSLFSDADYITKYLESQLEYELGFLSKLCISEYPGLKVKRYSVEREPIDIALHLAQVNLFLSKYLNKNNNALHRDDINKCIDKNIYKIAGYVSTLEHSTTIKAQGYIITYPSFRKGYPFWADGSNVPYNFSSGISLGLLSANKKHFDSKANQYLQPLLGEINSMTDDKFAWRYWWGIGNSGWNETQNVSFNTPNYIGNRDGLAHITYLTIDAKAVLSLNKRVELDEKIIHRIENMTKKGLLLPSVNEFYSENKMLTLETIPRLRYSRASAIWELQSQPYALISH